MRSTTGLQNSEAQGWFTSRLSHTPALFLHGNLILSCSNTAQWVQWKGWKSATTLGIKASQTVHEKVFLTRYTKESFGKVCPLGFFLPPKVRISISAGDVQEQTGNLACNTTCEITTPTCRLLKTKQQPTQLKSLIS